MNLFLIRNILLSFLFVILNKAYCVSIVVNYDGFGECNYRPLTINAGGYEPVIIMGLKPGRTYKVQITKKPGSFEHDPNKILLNISEKVFNVNVLGKSLWQIVFPKIKVIQSPHIITFDLYNLDENNSNYEISVASDEREMQQIEQKKRDEYYRKINSNSNEQELKIFTTMETVMKKNIPIFNLNMQSGDLTFGSGMKMFFQESKKLMQDYNNNEKKTDSDNEIC